MAISLANIVLVVVDLAVILAVWLPVALLHFHGVPRRRGFFCDDDSIRHPFNDSTITSNTLYAVGILVPVSVITLNEFLISKKNDERMSIFLGTLYKQIVVLVFGAGLSQLTTDIAKYGVGRLRPHFLDVCQPDVNCNLDVNMHIYFEKYTCQGTDKELIRQARLSFPSGHSSFSAYTMVYLVLYLQRRMCSIRFSNVKPLVQFVLLMMSWYTALSRIGDYKHHWGDVTVGLLQGTLVAFITAYFISDLFKPVIRDEKMTPCIQGAPSTKTYNDIDLEQQ